MSEKTNKTKEGVTEIDTLVDLIDTLDLDKEKREKILLQIAAITILLMEAHIMLARCKEIMIEHNIIKDVEK